MRTAKPWILPEQPALRAILIGGGVSAAMVRRQLAAGRLIRVRSGVYVAADVWPDDPAGQHLVRAHAEQAVNPAAVLSHDTAALAWRLPHPGFAAWADSPVTVTVPAGGAPQVPEPRGRPAPAAAARSPGDERPAGLPHHNRAADRRRPGWRATPAGGAGDPRRCRPPSLPVARCRRQASGLRQPAAGGVHQGHAPRSSERPPAPWPHGCDRSDRPGSGVAGGVALRRVVCCFGTTDAAFQPPVDTPFGTLYPHCLWPEARLIGECDGAVKYADANGYVAEKEREQILRDLDYRVVRWLAKEIMPDPRRVVDRVARKLES